MKRSPLNRKTPLKRGGQLRRTRLAPTSKKRQAERQARRDTIDTVVMRDGAQCCAVDLVPHVACWGPLDADEWELRSARPGGHLDPGNVQILCRAHHDWKHANPIEAAHVGLRPYPASYTGHRIQHVPPGERVTRANTPD